MIILDLSVLWCLLCWFCGGVLLAGVGGLFGGFMFGWGSLCWWVFCRLACRFAVDGEDFCCNFGFILLCCLWFWFTVVSVVWLGF